MERVSDSDLKSAPKGSWYDAKTYQKLKQKCDQQESELLELRAEVARLRSNLRSTEDQLIEVDKYLGAVCGDEQEVQRGGRASE